MTSLLFSSLSFSFVPFFFSLSRAMFMQELHYFANLIHCCYRKLLPYFRHSIFFSLHFTTRYVWCYNDLLRKISMPIFHTYIFILVWCTFSESFWALWIRNGLHWIGRNFSPSASSQRIIAILYSHSILHECSFVYRHPFYYGCSG